MKIFFKPAVIVTALLILWSPTHASRIHADGVATSELSLSNSVNAENMWTSGTVVRVSIERGKVTIEHGPIMRLGMMAMTMPFTVSDPALLEGLATGDRIEFVADKNGAELVVKDLRRPAS